MPDEREHAPEALVDVATAVADRTPVAWGEAQARTPDLAPAIERLREIAALEAACARLLADEPSGAAFTWGPLQVFERIGEGSFAEVFRARDAALQREVALKLRRTDVEAALLGSRRWIEEARRLARVRHPNVLLVYGAEEHDGRAGIWSELVRGSTLEQWIRDHGPLGPREAAGIGVDLCAALAAVHRAGLVHGDVTTRNIMREGAAGATDGSGRIVLMDFGSAHDAIRTTPLAFGTPLFMAPEVLAGTVPDARADVYALGVVLFRLLTARYPVEGDSLQQIRERLASGGRAELRGIRPDLPPALVRAIERACHPDPAARFSTAGELEAALAATLPAAGSAAETTRASARATWPLVLGAVALLALAAWLVPWLAGGSRRPARGGAGPPAATTRADESLAPGAPPAQAPGTGAGASAAAAAPQLDATLVRVTAGGREPLGTGDLVAPGDELALEAESRTPAYVYVLSEDEQGAVFALFPLRGRGTPNPIAAGVRHRLPGGEGVDALSWQVTSAGGRETFLILAAGAPLAPVAEAIARFPEPSPGAPVTYAPLPAEALARLRGVGGVIPAAPASPAPGAGVLARLAHDLASGPTGRDVWIRLIVLENPRP